MSWNAHTTHCIDLLDVGNFWSGWGVNNEVTCLTISCNDLLFVASKESWPIRSWNIRDKCSTQFVLAGHTDTTVCLCSAKNEKIVSGSKDMTLRVWDVCNFTCLLTIQADGCPSHVEIADDKIIGMIVKGENTRLKIWNLESGDHLHTVKVVEKCTTFAYRKGSLLLGLASPVNYSIMHPDCNCIPVTRKEIKESDSKKIDRVMEGEKRCSCVHLTEQLAIFSIVTDIITELNIGLLSLFNEMKSSATKRIGIYGEIVSMCSSETMIFVGDRDSYVHFFGIPDV
jgi:WD40 repeat protein